MRGIGLRAEKDRVHYAIVEGASASPVLIARDKIAAPLTFDLPEQLTWYRKRVVTLIEEFDCDSVCIRVAETFLQRKPTQATLASMLSRSRIEGVLLEAAGTKKIHVMNGKLQQIAAKLGEKSAKNCIDSEDFRGISLLEIRNKNSKESVLAAVAAIGEK